MCETCLGHRYYRVPICFADDWKADTFEPCPDCNPDGEFEMVVDPEIEPEELDETPFQ